MEHLDEDSWIKLGTLPDGIYKDNFCEMWDLHPESLSTIKIYGKTIQTPRWVQTYITPYMFSGVVHDAIPLPEQFKPYLDWVDSLGHGPFNMVLANFYKDGSHYIGNHSDSEEQLVKYAPIVSISFGDTRTFRIRSKNTGKVVKDIELTHLSYVVMGGKMQERYTHEVPKTTKSTKPRINLTFRQSI